MVSSDMTVRPCHSSDIFDDEEFFYRLPYSTLILDIGGVLLDFSVAKESSIPPEIVKRIFRLSTWFDFERGTITESECYAALAEEIGYTAAQVSQTMQAMRRTLLLNESLMGVLRSWKAARPSTRIFLMSNISAPDWDYVRAFFAPSDLALFSRVFTSAAAGIRKPELGFYDFVLRETRTDPRRTLYVDDRLENVVSARSFGLKTVTFKSADSLFDHIKALGTRCPKALANAYLSSGASKLSVTDDGRKVREIFTELLERDAVDDRMYVEGLEQQPLVNFFKDTVVQSGEKNPFPPDLDTTSIAWTVASNADPTTKHWVMDEMLKYVNADGIVQCYFDVTRARIDPVACANVLHFFHHNGRGAELARTLNWVLKVLEHRAYLDGTLYYRGPEPFLYFMSRLAVDSDPATRKRIMPLLQRRVSERLGADGDPLALAMRIVAAARAGLFAAVDLAHLKSLQEPDGSWPIGWMYNYGGSGIKFGSKRLTSAVALQAIRATETLEKGEHVH